MQWEINPDHAQQLKVKRTKHYYSMYWDDSKNEWKHLAQEQWKLNV